MTVDTEGPIRGMIGRWLMRFEAASQILSIGFQGTTAVSALSGVLTYSGFQSVVPVVLAVGVPGVFIFAFAYTELGLWNRKNREKADFGNNFARPDMRIDDEIIGAAVFAAMHGEPPDEDERAAIAEATDTTWRDLRSGVDVE